MKILAAWISPLHRMAATFMAGISTMAVTLCFLGIIAVVAIPIGHHVWSYWHGIATSLQASSVKAAEIRGRK